MRGLVAIFLILVPAPALAKRSDEESARQIIRAYTAATESKDYALLRAVTWPDGVHCPRKPAECKRFDELNNFFGGAGITYKNRFTNWQMRRGVNWIEIVVTQFTRRFYDDEFSGMSSKGKVRFRVTNRAGQWRVAKVDKLGGQVFGDDIAWQKRHKR